VTARPWQRRLAVSCFVLLVVLLPALVAGWSLAAAAAPGEWERVAAAGSATGGPVSLVASGFLRSTLGAAAAATEALDPAARLSQARLAQILGLMAMGGLTYLALALAGGRWRALLAVAFLSALPPIAQEGHVVRPETPALVFGLLALLLLECVTVVQRPAAATRAPRSVTTALALTAALAIAFAVAALPSAGILLLLPGAASVLAVAQIGVRLLRSLRRRSLAVLPLRATSARLWPWVLAAIAAMLATALVVEASVRSPDGLVPSPSAVGLLPAAPLLRYPLLLLAALGGVRLLLRAGQRLGRRGRLGADALVLLYGTVLLLQRGLREGGEDALPAVVPVALLLADGAIYATLLAARRR
jgi:hypothetical protein